MPPEWMWPFPEELEIHFDELKAKRGQGASDDDEGAGMIRNEDPRLAKLRGR